MSETKLAAKAPEERRERILRATVSVIRERGFAGTRVSDIAREAGTSQGLILYHFGSLEGALAAAVTLSEAEFLRDVAAELQAAAGPLEKLRVIAELVPGEGPAVSDWQLWLELWARAIRDDGARNLGRRCGSRGLCMQRHRGQCDAACLTCRWARNPLSTRRLQRHLRQIPRPVAWRSCPRNWIAGDPATRPLMR